MTGSPSSGFPRIDFDALYRGESPAEGVPAMTTPPWDTKAPKESVVSWQTAGWIHGDVLDIGCGLGDNAIYLAQQGHAVTGLDISPTALLTDAFDTVIDSGMYHCLDEQGKRSYARAVYRATRADATLLLSCFSDAGEPDPERPRPVVSEQVLRDTLGGAGWDIVSLEPSTVRREEDGTEIEMAFWLVRAQRRTLTPVR